ncbi:hypothetical protein [Streptomyces sp. SID3343]|uniref:hypothetical protein n=1 Tax=Streptomyces sp. SID3343 TaxID=2690260 RepID=UPI00136CDEF1|nr:hypothetical protein [Streptomyces sp. SID3343]MYV99125.1 hypothetical protein [Streptomyces sp. SID3343]
MPQPDWQLTEFSYAQDLIVARYKTPDGDIKFETLRVHRANVPALIAELFKTMDQNLRVDVLAEVNAANDRVVASRRAAIGRAIARAEGLPGADAAEGDRAWTTANSAQPHQPSIRRRQ